MAKQNKLQTAIVREIEHLLKDSCSLEVSVDCDADISAVKRKDNAVTFNVTEYSYDETQYSGTRKAKSKFKLVLTAVK